MGKRQIMAACLLAAGYLALCICVKPDRIWPNRIINGIDLGGMTLREAQNRLAEDTESRLEALVFTVSLDEKEYEVSVGNALAFDDEALLLKKLLPEQEHLLLRGVIWLKASVSAVSEKSGPVLRDPELLRAAIRASGLPEEDDTVQTSYRKEEDRLIFSMGKAEVTVDEEKLADEIMRAVQEDREDRRIVCPVKKGIVEPVDLERVRKEIHTDPVNAALDPEHDYAITESVTGVDLDVEYARSVLDAAEEGSTVAVDLICTEPEITTADMEESLFADELASFTTRVNGNADYSTNVLLAAEQCDGVILLKGDTFSFNEAVGEQTPERGFRKASATRGTERILAYGGGICQVSSTIFVAALYAGLEIPERWSHTYVCSYVDAGLDAAVAWNVLDFRVANPREYPVMLEVRYVNRDLTVTILGTRTEDTPIEVETEILDASEEYLKVQTSRKTYSPDRAHVFLERISYSEYLDPWMRVD